MDFKIMKNAIEL